MHLSVTFVKPMRSYDPLLLISPLLLFVSWQKSVNILITNMNTFTDMVSIVKQVLPSLIMQEKAFA